MKNKMFDKTKKMAEDEITLLPIESIRKQTTDEYLLRFKSKINHDPGQFFMCGIPGIGESAISICSYASDYFELSIRAVGNVTKALCALKKGDKVALRGPYGHGYEMEKFKAKDLVVIGGGCGVAPVRGILEFVSKNRPDYGDVEIFFGFNEDEDILFEVDYSEWEKNDMKVGLALNAEGFSCTRAQKGFVTNILGDLQANKNKVAFLCGPPIMIESTVKMLLEKGFQKNQIYVSEERHMKCGVGRCGHCMMKGKYCCTDGPVFRYDKIN